MAFKKGEVVLIPFPYTDLSASKTRPAVIVSSDNYHTVRSELLLAYVSSHVAKANPILDYILAEVDLLTQPIDIVQTLAEKSIIAIKSLAVSDTESTYVEQLQKLLKE